MTFEDAEKEISKIIVGEEHRILDILQELQATYAPKIKMTAQEFERFGKRFATSGISGFKIELDKNGEEHSLYTKTELLAWLHPELIEVEK